MRRHPPRPRRSLLAVTVRPHPRPRTGSPSQPRRPVGAQRGRRPPRGAASAPGAQQPRGCGRRNTLKHLLLRPRGRAGRGEGGEARGARRGVWEEPQGLWRKEAAELRDRGHSPAPRPQAADGPQRGAAAATVDAGVLLGTDSRPRRGRGCCPESASSVRRGGAARAPAPERARRLGVCLGGSQPAPPPG